MEIKLKTLRILLQFYSIMNLWAVSNTISALATAEVSQLYLLHFILYLRVTAIIVLN